MQTQSRSYLLAGLTILFWSTAATAFKLTLEHFTPIQLLAWSSLFASLILFVIILFSGKLAALGRVPRKEVARSVLLGLFNPFAYYLILFRAYELLPAQVAQPLNFIWPLVLVLLSVPLLRQKFTARGAIALSASFVGVVLISSQGRFDIFSLTNPLGAGLALLSSVFWALYWIFNLKAIGVEPEVRLFLNFSFATPLIFILGSFHSGFWELNVPGVLGSLYVGSFEMGFAFVLWLKALALASSTARISNTVYLVPFLSLLAIHLVLKETIHWTTPIGLLIIVGSIVFQQMEGKGNKIAK